MWTVAVIFGAIVHKPLIYEHIVGKIVNRK